MSSQFVLGQVGWVLYCKAGPTKHNIFLLFCI